MDIAKMLTLSTVHVTKETSLLLDAYLAAPQDGVKPECDFDGLSIYPKGEYGWFFYIHDAFDDPEAAAKLPTDLIEVVKFARGWGCDWLCLDCDAGDVDELPSYEW